MIIGLSAVAAALATLQTPTTGPSGPMSIDDAVNIALRNAFAIQLQQSAVRKNNAKIDEAKAFAMPQIKTTTTYTRNEKQITFNTGGTTFVSQPLSTTVFSSQLSFSIDLVGNIRRGIRATRLSAMSSQAAFEATQNDVRQNTRQAFYNVTRAQESVKVFEAALQDAQERYKQADQQFNQQQIARVDLLRFQTQVDQAKADLLTGQNNLQLAKNQFNLALALPIEAPVDLIPPSALPASDLGVESLVSSAYKNRPDVRQWTYTVESLEIVRKVQELGNMPTLDLNVNYLRNIDGIGFGQANESKNAQLVLKFPLYDGGTVRAKVKEAKEDEVQAKIQLDQLKLTISNEVRTAATNLQSAKARVENGEEQVKLATEVYRLAKVKQDAGAGTYVEVIDAQNQLVQARNALVAARYDYFSAFAQLQRAIGTDQVQAQSRQVQETSSRKEGN